MKAMILAAGLGTRLRPQTLKMPKPAIPLLNIPLVGYSIYLLKSAGVQTLVCNTHHLPELMKGVVTQVTGHFDLVDFSNEAGVILGSAGGVKHAEKFFNGAGDFLLANGDEVFFPTNAKVLAKLFETRRKISALSTLLVQENPFVGSKFGGVWIDRSGVVHGFGKVAPGGRTDLKGMHFTGYQALDEKVLTMIPEGKESNIFYDILVKAIADGKIVNTIVDQGLWMEMGNAADFLEASQVLLTILEKGVFPDGSSIDDFKKFLDWGWATFDPSDFRKNASSRVLISRAAKLPSGIEFSGDVVIGRGTAIATSDGGKTLRIQDSILVGKITALPDSKLSDQLLVGD